MIHKDFWHAKRGFQFICRSTTDIFTGMVPRVAKIAPACAVMIGSYEYFKVYFQHLNSSRANLSHRPEFDLSSR